MTLGRSLGWTSIVLSRILFYIGSGVGLFLVIQISSGEQSKVASWIKVLPNNGFLVVQHIQSGLIVGYSPPVEDSRARPPPLYAYSRIFMDTPSSAHATGSSSATGRFGYLNITFNPSGKLMLVPVRLYHIPVGIPDVLCVIVGTLIMGVAAIDLILVRRGYRRYQRRIYGFCPNCGYDLQATPNRCPECGTEGHRHFLNELKVTNELKVKTVTSTIVRRTIGT